jgi:tetratricopeptide (TPR) repeat protein
LKLQQPEAALAAYDQALKLRPRYAEALCGRAVALKYLRRFDEALACFDTVLLCDPSSPHIKNNKGALLLLRGDFARASSFMILWFGNPVSHYPGRPRPILPSAAAAFLPGGLLAGALFDAVLAGSHRACARPRASL